MDYKDDMDGEKFETFLRETCAKLKDKYEKSAIIMDNASYHTKLVIIVKSIIEIMSHWSREVIGKYTHALRALVVLF